MGKLGISILFLAFTVDAWGDDSSTEADFFVLPNIPMKSITLQTGDEEPLAAPNSTDSPYLNLEVLQGFNNPNLAIQASEATKQNYLMERANRQADQWINGKGPSSTESDRKASQ